MAAVQNTPEVKDLKTEETAPAVATIVEPATIEETPISSTQPLEENKTAETVEEPKAEDKVVDEAKPVEETKAEEKKEEIKPVEEGHLGHKAQGASFPKNLIPSKEFFFFGTDAFEPKTLASYQKNEKSSATYHANVAWASETGKGLLFIGDKKAPTGVINLSDAKEPETEGTNKFTLTSKGNKHSFKATTTAERDNWVAQLKLKIAEAKELAPTVTESTTYKATLESFKPVVPVKKEEPKKEETPVVAADKPAEETPVVAADKTVEEPKADEAVKEEDKAEKAQSPNFLKTKRASFFGFINKKDEPKEDKKDEIKKDEPIPVVTDKPAEETPVVAADKPVEESKIVEPIKTDAEATKPEEKTSEEAKRAESPKEKSSKRNSFFGGILSKKEKKAAEAKPVESTETPKEGEAAPVTETTAPVIPPVEATTPLAVDVNNTATTPAAETTESPVAASNGEPKKDTKEKRKSSLPFLGKREKSPAPAEGETKSSTSAFSKLRATIKGKSGSPKAEEKTTEEAKKDEEVVPEAKADETAVVPEPVKVEPVQDETVVKPAETEADKPEKVATTTPAVTAAA